MRITNVPFYSLVPLGSDVRLVSQPLEKVKQIEKGLMIFPPGTNHQLYYRLYWSSNSKLPASGPPTDQELSFPDQYPASYTGDGIAYPVRWERLVADETIYLKCYMANSLTFNVYGACVIDILKDS